MPHECRRVFRSGLSSAYSGVATTNCLITSFFNSLLRDESSPETVRPRLLPMQKRRWYSVSEMEISDLVMQSHIFRDCRQTPPSGARDVRAVKYAIIRDQPTAMKTCRNFGAG